jgi:alpha-1,2-glucosyltransferase
MASPQAETGLTLAARYLVPFILLLFLYWRAQVNATIPEPYLDEVFHVRQAQTYWAHNWTQWDPKITTPPGLYMWSYILCASLLLLRGSPRDVGPIELRATNLFAAGLVLPWRLQALLDLLRKEKNTRPSGASISQTVLNICLFPPLFFFSALYYTDILALLVVIEAYIWDINRSSRSSAGGKAWTDALRAQVSFATLGFMIFGLAALGFRQTNIFWVSVFLGGLQVVRVIRQKSKICKSSNVLEIFEGGRRGELYDPLIEDASFAGKLNITPSLG